MDLNCALQASKAHFPHFPTSFATHALGQLIIATPVTPNELNQFEHRINVGESDSIKHFMLEKVCENSVYSGQMENYVQRGDLKYTCYQNPIHQ